MPPEAVERIESTASQTGAEQSFADLLERVTLALEQQGSVGVERLLQSHPQHADRLRELLPAMAAMASWARDPNVVANDEPAMPGTEPVGGVLGDFRIIREIGRGGMGVVYEAEQISLRRRVALKTLPFAAVLDKQQLARFEVEARAAAALHHTNIVPVFSIGCDRGVHYYAMQYVEGRTLAELIGELRSERHGTACQGLPKDTAARAKDTTMPDFPSPAYFSEVARVGIQAAEALHHAHQQGIIHRDVKPGNLLVDAFGDLWITDFGLAQVQCGATLTLTGDLLGTIGYMSPEQASGHSQLIDHRTDIYSLGLTLYELLTLRAAFGGEDRRRLLGQIAEADVKRPRTVEPTVPRDLETVFLKSLAREPSQRYATAQDMADDLRRFIEHRPIQARRPTLAQYVSKWCRRHRAAALTAAFGAVLLLMFGAAVVADRWCQVREASRFVESSLRGALLAFEADDVKQAMLRLSEAQTRIEADGPVDQQMAQAVASLKQEAERYANFVPLLEEARWRRSRPQGEELLLEHKALALYHVVDNADWLEPLKVSNLPETHVARVSDGVYELLLRSADTTMRWYHLAPKSTRDALLAERCDRALRYLSKAVAHHAPSRGYYWLLANHATFLKDKDKATRLRKLALETPVHHTAELYYVNVDRRWGTVSQNRGFPEYPIEENYKAHREMLRRDPSYYNGLFFMSIILSGEERLDEALVGWYGCLALRPNDATALVNRSMVHLKLGHLDEALADSELALAIAPDRAVSYCVLAFVLATCPSEEIRDGKRAVELATKACELTGYEDDGSLDALATACAEVGDFEAAVKWADKALKLAYDHERDEIAKHLESFKGGKPWREGPTSAGQ